MQLFHKVGISFFYYYFTSRLTAVNGRKLILLTSYRNRVMYDGNTIKRRCYHDYDETELIIPDYDPYNPKPYPGDIKPGYYSKAQGQEAS